MPAFQPYRGKPAVRNDREGRGNVGIIRSPVRASTLPDCGGARDETRVPTATVASCVSLPDGRSHSAIRPLPLCWLDRYHVRIEPQGQHNETTLLGWQAHETTSHQDGNGETQYPRESRSPAKFRHCRRRDGASPLPRARPRCGGLLVLVGRVHPCRAEATEN